MLLDTTNRFPVIATCFTPAHEDYSAGRIILVDKGEKHEPRYLVGWQRYSDSYGARWCGEWESVRYCRTLQDARKEFCKRVKKEPA